MVYKSGEIIPKVKEVRKEKRPDGWKRFMIPDVCPVCGAKTEREKDTADIKCTSPNCPAQLERHIINFVGRDAMDIKGFGTVYIEELVRLGYIKDIADIFELKDHREELIEQGIIGKEKNTDKLLETIEKAKENDAYMLLTGFGIPNVGKAAAKTIMKRFPSILDLEDADRDALMEVDDVGEVSADCIFRFFHDEKNKENDRPTKVFRCEHGSGRDRDDRFGSQWKNSCHHRYTADTWKKRSGGTGGEIRRKSIRIRIEKDRLCCCRRECGQQTDKGTGTWNHGAHGSRTVCTAWNQRREWRIV